MQWQGKKEVHDIYLLYNHMTQTLHSLMFKRCAHTKPIFASMHTFINHIKENEKPALNKDLVKRNASTTNIFKALVCIYFPKPSPTGPVDLSTACQLSLS